MKKRCVIFYVHNYFIQFTYSTKPTLVDKDVKIRFLLERVKLMLCAPHATRSVCLKAI